MRHTFLPLHSAQEDHTFTLQQRALNQVVLHAFSTHDPGLLHGRMGISLTLFLASRHLADSGLARLAGALTDTVTGHLSRSMPLNFSRGLCGIGWGILYLLHERMVSGDVADVLAEIDRCVMQLNPVHLDSSLTSGICGLLHYVLARLKADGSCPFEDDFMSLLHDRSHDLCRRETSEGLQSCGGLSFLAAAFLDYYEERDWHYDFDILKFAASPLPDLSEEYLATSPLSLHHGLCGYLVRWLLDI